ncbi:C4-dicarboxylate ABC transporter [Pelistega indica]|uniref:TRAP transporter small permease protein n=1 Tax=Pelistega indica TaxID=1414851 RepID=V8G4K1_9BURK|nr:MULTISPECIES: TRAP transporter small permease [Pelistega]ETD70602.1 C4-dicarboxylate ABC transporter [Pelistega indica]
MFEQKKWLVLEDTLQVILLAALACITMGNVLVRYFSTQSFAWTEEISIFLLILVTMLGTSSAFVRYQHIRIELLLNRATTKTRQVLDFLSGTICLLFFILFTVLLAKLCLDEMEYGDVSPAIGIPTWWYSIFLPILSTLITFRLLRQWWVMLVALKRGDA